MPVLLGPDKWDKPKGPPFWYRYVTDYCIVGTKTTSRGEKCLQCQWIEHGANSLFGTSSWGVVERSVVGCLLAGWIAVGFGTS